MFTCGSAVRQGMISIRTLSKLAQLRHEGAMLVSLHPTPLPSQLSSNQHPKQGKQGKFCGFSRLRPRLKAPRHLGWCSLSAGACSSLHACWVHALSRMKLCHGHASCRMHNPPIPCKTLPGICPYPHWAPLTSATTMHAAVIHQPHG